MLLKGGGLIRRADVRYWQRFGPNVLQADGQIALTDGRTLRLIEDGSGHVAEAFDLVKIGGEDDTYFVEGFGPDYLLIRANRNGLLQLIDRRSGEKTALYRELLPEAAWEYTETNDLPYRGDRLVFVKEVNGELLFRNEAYVRTEKTASYVYRLKP